MSDLPSVKEFLSKHSKAKVSDKQIIKPDCVLLRSKDLEILLAKSSLNIISEKMTLLESRLRSKEEEVEILKGMLAQKDEEIDRLKDKLLVRNLEVDILRAEIESAWKNFDTSETIRSSKIRSNNEIKHEKEPREETKGMAPKQDGLFNMISLPLLPDPSPFSTFIGPPCPPYLSTAESDIVGAMMFNTMTDLLAKLLDINLPTGHPSLPMSC